MLLQFDVFESWLENKDIAIKDSKIYLADSEIQNKYRLNKEGLFVPRLLIGYVVFNPDIEIYIENYIHELTHGSFFENFEIGKKIVELDKRLYSLKNEIGITEEIGIQGIVGTDSDKIVRDGDKLLIPVKIFENIIETDTLLKRIYSDNFDIIEAFSLLTYEEYANRESIIKRYDERYQKALSKLKMIGSYEDIITALKDNINISL